MPAGLLSTGVRVGEQVPSWAPLSLSEGQRPWSGRVAVKCLPAVRLAPPPGAPAPARCAYLMFGFFHWLKEGLFHGY